MMAEQGRRSNRWRVDGAVPVGIALIGLGVLLTLDAFEVVEAGEVLAGWWPAAVVLAGLWWLVTGSMLVGAVVAVVGGLLLATTQDLVEVPVGELIFPGLLIVLGGAMLHAGAQLRAARLGAGAWSGSPEGAALPSPAESSATAVFGDARIRVGEDGTDVGRVVISATSMFGDVHVEVPAGWRIEDHITRVLGDVTLPATQPTYPESPVAELHGLVMFGDVRVRYVDLEGV
jgi:hypothetical protein